MERVFPLAPLVLRVPVLLALRPLGHPAWQEGHLDPLAHQGRQVRLDLLLRPLEAQPQIRNPQSP